MEEYVLQLIESGLPVSFRELLSLTLQEISSLIRGYQARLRHDKVMFGTVVSAIYNVNRKKGAAPLKWNDVFKDDSGKKEGHGIYMTGEEMSAKLHSLFGGVA